jgi:NitT/TauT family transport system ATP-binding protein
MTAQVQTDVQSGPDTMLMKVRGMSMSYGSGATENKILENLNLEVATGQFISIVGPSGVGKTTLLRCLSGLLRPKAGTIEVGRTPTWPSSSRITAAR